MKKFVLAAALVLSLALPVCAADWTMPAKAVKQSAVEISVNTDEGEAGACTGWVIDNERDYVITAAHCDGKTLYADNLKAEVKAKDTKTDLMVLYVKDIDRPSLKLAKKNPEVGQEVASFGWGYALEQPLFRVAHVSATNVALERAHYIAIDGTFVGGQSGGPVINPEGEVVLIVQMGNNVVGFGVGAETIEDKMGRFFSKK